jgi:hypothetical protein
VKVPCDKLKSISLSPDRPVDGEVYEQKGEEMLNSGLCMDLKAWGFHFLKFQGSAEKVF